MDEVNIDRILENMFHIMLVIHKKMLGWIYVDMQTI